MNLLLSNILKKPGRTIILLTIVVGFILVLASLVADTTKVSAHILPVVVSVDHLDFGTVFPGEERQGNFIVTYVEVDIGVNYQIVQERKPLPPEHPEYPNGGDPAMPGYYRDLCPFLEKVSVEQEGDTENLAFVGQGDLSDTWTIYFKVPAIVGNVAQEHIGGVVTSNGEYGCDVSIYTLD